MTMDWDGFARNLRVVASVPPGCRLGHGPGGGLHVCGPGFVGSALRFFGQESRGRTCATIATLLGAARERLADMEASRWAESPPAAAARERGELGGRARQLAEALRDAVGGMESLEATYATDAATVAHLAVLQRACAVLGARAEGLARALAVQGPLRTG